jgi:hypothetical protein
VQRDGLQLAADDPDRLEPDAVFVRKRRGQQRTNLHRDARTWFVLECSISEHRLYEKAGIGELDVGALLEVEFADKLHVPCDPIVENRVRGRDRVLATIPVEVEVAELDLDLSRLGDRRVS